HGVHVEQYTFHDEDGGHGEHRGGKGVILDYRMRTDDFTVTGSFGRSKFLPWGMDGGTEGSRNHLDSIRTDGRHEVHGKVTHVRLKKGDVVRMVTATGGGWGDPKKRDRAKVQRDVKNGYITPDQANKYY